MEKALICSYDYFKKRDCAEKLAVQFNPESYSIIGANSYEIDDKAFNNAYRGFCFAFTGRKASRLEVELLFDSYQHGLEDKKQTDVRAKFALLRKFQVVQPERHEPLVLKFCWGSLSFVGVITGLEERYTMFAETGIPVRARVKLTITGCREQDLSGAANESPDRTKRRTLAQGETLWDLATREYDSPQQWRVIARANGIEDPIDLPQGLELILPPLEGHTT